MPTTNTKTIKASGGDYTSLSNWEAGRQADLTSTDAIEVAECYDLGAADSTAVTIDGWTTSATQYIQITVPSAQRHAGIRSTAKYRLISSATFSEILSIKEAYVRVEGLQVSATGNGSYGITIAAGATSDVRITDTLVYDCKVDGVSRSTGVLTCNNVVSMHNTGAGFNGTSSSFDNSYYYNCTSVNNSTYGFTIGNFRTIVCKNCYAGGNTTADYGGLGTITKTTCHAADATGNTQTAWSTSSGGYFTNVTAGTEDIHIGASSGLINVGTDISADAHWINPLGYVDIDGTARTTGAGQTDVGADEYVSAGGVVIPVFMNQYRQRSN